MIKKDRVFAAKLRQSVRSREGGKKAPQLEEKILEFYFKDGRITIYPDKTIFIRLLLFKS